MAASARRAVARAAAALECDGDDQAGAMRYLHTMIRVLDLDAALDALEPWTG